MTMMRVPGRGRDACAASASHSASGGDPRTTGMNMLILRAFQTVRPTTTRQTTMANFVTPENDSITCTAQVGGWTHGRTQCSLSFALCAQTRYEQAVTVLEPATIGHLGLFPIVASVSRRCRCRRPPQFVMIPRCINMGERATQLTHTHNALTNKRAIRWWPAAGHPII